MARVRDVSGRQAPEAVNFAFLKGYAGGDETLVREVLAIFRAEAGEWAARLREGADAWRPLVHTMKGASRTVGADRLGDLCERAEDDGGASLPRVRAELDRVLARIDGYLAAPF